LYSIKIIRNFVEYEKSNTKYFGFNPKH